MVVWRITPVNGDSSAALRCLFNQRSGKVLALEFVPSRSKPKTIYSAPVRIDVLKSLFPL